MDVEISKWILEFLLRQALDERIINGALSSLPLKDDDYRFKKTLLLRRIEFEVSNAVVTEKLLELLEIVEELDHREQKSASDSMKSAYCAVAVDCTVRYLDENVENNATYFDAVKRVWRERVCKIKSLVSEWSEQKVEEIEAALWDSVVCGKLLKLNTRNEALRLLRAYLAEEWKNLGPTFLEVVADKVGNTLEARCSELENPCRESPAIGETRKGQTPIKRKRIAVRSKRGRGAKISDADDGNEDELMGNADYSLASAVDRVPAANESSFTELQTSKKVDLPTLQTAQTLPKATKNVNSKPLVEQNESSFMEVQASEKVDLPKATENVNSEPLSEKNKSSFMELQASKKIDLPNASLETAQTLPRATENVNSKHLVENQRCPATPEVERVREADKVSSMELLVSKKVGLPNASLQTAQTLPKATENVNSKTLVENQTGLATPDAERVRVALNASSAELHAAVTDPLPDALQTAQTLCSTLATDSRSGEPLVINQIGSETHPPPRASTDNDKENAEKKEDPTQEPQGNEAQHGMKLRTRRTLLEPDATAETFDWDDSIDNSLGGSSSRPHLPSPKDNKAPSPLKNIGDPKITKRRARKKWTVEEEDTLRTGVKKYGRGNWKLILNSYREIFCERTEVDLKDKWRNLTRWYHLPS